MNGRLRTEADIPDAIAWRLSGLSADEVRNASEALFAAAVVVGPSRVDESVLEIHSASLRTAGDRREPFSLGCALISNAAQREKL